MLDLDIERFLEAVNRLQSISKASLSLKFSDGFVKSRLKRQGLRLTKKWKIVSIKDNTVQEELQKKYADLLSEIGRVGDKNKACRKFGTNAVCFNAKLKSLGARTVIEFGVGELI